MKLTDRESDMTSFKKSFTIIYLIFSRCSALDLTGKTYLVTGSTDGIGQHTAQKLAQHGATVLIHGRSRTDSKP